MRHLKASRVALRFHRALLLSAAATVSLTYISPARATYTWTAGTDFWNIASNWSSNAIPDSANDASVANGGYAFVIANQSANDLSVDAYTTFTHTATNNGSFSVGSASTAVMYYTTFFQTAGTLTVTNASTLTLVTADPDAIRQFLSTHQLFSSTIDNQAQSIHALGYLINPDNSLALQYTLQGDANLDGQLNADDYALLDRAYAQNASNPHWQDGDFNYDGLVTSADYLLLDTAYLSLHPSNAPTLLSQREAQFGKSYATQLLTNLPEPSFLTFLLTGPLLLRLRPYRFRRT